MKKLSEKIRYTIEGETAFLFARLKDGGSKWIRFASCHPSVIPAIKQDGFNAHRALIRIVAKP